MDLRIRISKKQKSENRNPEIGKIEFVSNLIKTKNENLDVKKKNRNRRNQIFQNKKTNLDNFREKKSRSRSRSRDLFEIQLEGPIFLKGKSWYFTDLVIWIIVRNIWQH